MKEKAKEIITKGKKANNGITLIALVITIIVLLILAGVVIATLTGDNGILTKAGDARNASTEAEIKEKIKLAYQDYYMAKYTNPGYTLQNALANAGLTGATVTGDDTNGWTVTYNNKAYPLSAIGQVGDGVAVADGGQSGSGTGGTSQALSTLTATNYGDYIDLGQSVVGTSATTDDWRILYNDTTNNVVYAILTDYLPNNNAAVTATGLDTYGTYNVYSNTDRDTLLAGLNHATAWNGLIPSTLVSRGVSVKGAVTEEILMASYNAKYNTNLNYTGSYEDRPYLYIDADSSKGIDSLYMPHPSESEDCYGYWLASPDLDWSNGVCDVYYEGYVYNTHYSTAYRGLCPVVSLPSDIQVTKNGTVWTVVQ